MMLDIGGRGMRRGNDPHSQKAADPAAACAVPAKALHGAVKQPFPPETGHILKMRAHVPLRGKTEQPQGAGKYGTLVLRPNSDVVNQRPASAPADLFSPDPSSIVSGNMSGLPLKRAICLDDALLCNEHRRRPLAVAGDGMAAPFRSIAIKVRAALVDARDAVYEGVNATGRGIRRAYHVVHDACVSLGEHAANAKPASAGASRPVAKQSSSAADDSPISGFPAAAYTIRKALENSATKIDLAGTAITYSNVLYLMKDKTSRKNEDAAGCGLKASNPDYSDLLTRGLATAMRNARNPENAVLIAARPADIPELKQALEQYKAYRDSRYPDFEEIYQRLSGFGDHRTINAVERTIAERRAASEAQGKAWDENAYVGDELLNPNSDHPVTALQFSRDLDRMRGYLQDLAAHLEQLA